MGNSLLMDSRASAGFCVVKLLVEVISTSAKPKDDRLSRWVTNIANKKHPNVAAVALANKTARMAWAMLRNETDYDPDFALR